ncbi:MAG: ATP-binding protein [Desulfovibrio sp.]|nr:ATP-binding protein [Desulfovibrio sp.]
MLDALPRLPEACQLVLDHKYFAIHAARQSGKTTLLMSLVDRLNALDDYCAVYCSLEAVQGYSNPKKGLHMIIDIINNDFSKMDYINSFTRQPHGDDATGIRDALSNIAKSIDRKLVIFFDEADCLSCETLISFLRQLRNGYIYRKQIPFPWSIALVGMRDIRDYKAHIRPDSDTLGSASPFNIITESLTLRNFTGEQIKELYFQHTTCTGQIFEDAAIDRAYYWSEGQPWLVNALAHQIIEKDLRRDYTQIITSSHFDAAAESIILRRDIHIDSLLDRLKEARVQRIIEPIIYGGDISFDMLSDDVQFCLNIGLVAGESLKDLHIANPIYNEVITRTLTYIAQEKLPESLINRWMDGESIDISALLKEFQKFWRENSEIWIEKFQYKEAAPHLILYAYLQRVVNGGGRIRRDAALGTGRADICVSYAGKKYPIELKLAGTQPISESLEQVNKYMERCGSAVGWLGIFDRSKTKPWSKKIYWKTKKIAGDKVVHIFGC